MSNIVVENPGIEYTCHFCNAKCRASSEYFEPRYTPAGRMVVSWSINCANCGCKGWHSPQPLVERENQRMDGRKL